MKEESEGPTHYSWRDHTNRSCEPEELAKVTKSNRSKPFLVVGMNESKR